jgi:hypothetical protein
MVGGPTPGFVPSFQKCSQCGTFHPAVSGPCPMAKNSGNPEDVEIEKFLNNMRIQLKVKLTQAKPKEVGKLFVFLSLELAKIIESYKE